MPSLVVLCPQWVESGHYEHYRMSRINGPSNNGGEYDFGGTLKLASDGTNFTGDSIAVPGPILAGIHRYQGCLDRGALALEPLDQTKLQRLKAVTTGCTRERAAAIEDAVQALVQAGADEARSERAIHNAFDQIDAKFAALVHVLEAGPPPKN
jgi:hypothetical protein